ncbi:MAG: hypothetical protein ACODAU_08360 [Myxococcota bacterium]
MRRIIGPALIAFLLTACGNGAGTDATADPEPTAATAGGEGPDVETERASMGVNAAEEAEPDGEGQLTVQILVDGEQTPGRVQVQDQEGEVVSEGASGDTFTVPTGHYVLVGHVEDASILVDTPTKESGPIAIGADEERTEEIEIGRAKVRLKIYKGQRRIRNARVELRQEGGEEVVHEYKPGNDHIRISPGRYDAVVHLPKDTQVDVDGLIFMPGATQDIPIRIN